MLGTKEPTTTMEEGKPTESKIIREKKEKIFEVFGEEEKSMPIELFREEWLRKGYDLVDVTRLCVFKLGDSGWCSRFNSPDEKIYHIQVWYRDENIGVFNPSKEQNFFDDKYLVFVEDEDFIIFRKVKI